MVSATCRRFDALKATTTGKPHTWCNVAAVAYPSATSSHPVASGVPIR
ncbi:hypothetical protein [Cupriavidus sp. D39]|nr:hypothetical protein [Cupriavidus sp. D39]MCY0858089.1 hypothetical protein [Cupriavidus sp. D39]